MDHGNANAAAAAWDDDDALLAALRRGEQEAFVALVERYGGGMVRFAHLFTTDRALIEDAVQEAWLGVLRGIHRFEGRASLRTWLFHVLSNCLRALLRREGRLVPFSRLHGAEAAEEPTVAPERFLPADHPRWPHHWQVPPGSWGESPEAQLLSEEVQALVRRAIAALPPAQRAVVTLRDVEGWSAAEVCLLLDIGESNQRVLLHRARSKVRGALEDYFTRG